MAGSFTLLLVCSAFALFIWFAFVRKTPRSPPQLQIDDPAQPYSAFTTQFDAEALGSEIAEALEAMPPNRRIYSRTMKDRSWSSRITTASEAYAAARALTLEPWLVTATGDTVVVLLVDLSGSMGETIVPLAGELRRCCETISEAGIPIALLGFTTVGWRGGQSRQKWFSAGSPSRPGRLCDLLHVTFKQFDEELKDDDWQTMLHPGLLCENVDGEALEWAANMLKTRAEPNKVLVVLSDGAPVDDSTLVENGAEFLVRHIRSVIAKLEQDRSLSLGAIGIGFAVDEYYAKSIQMAKSGTLSEKLSTLLAALTNRQDQSPEKTIRN